MAKSNKFIQGAIKHPGALTAKAKAAHKTLSQFEASPGPRETTETKRQIAFAKTLHKFDGKDKNKK